jgi:hypothetical protein
VRLKVTLGSTGGRRYRVWPLVAERRHPCLEAGGSWKCGGRAKLRTDRFQHAVVNMAPESGRTADSGREATILCGGKLCGFQNAVAIALRLAAQFERADQKIVHECPL